MVPEETLTSGRNVLYIFVKILILWHILTGDVHVLHVSRMCQIILKFVFTQPVIIIIIIISLLINYYLKKTWLKDETSWTPNKFLQRISNFFINTFITFPLIFIYFFSKISEHYQISFHSSERRLPMYFYLKGTLQWERTKRHAYQ